MDGKTIYDMESFEGTSSGNLVWFLQTTIGPVFETRSGFVARAPWPFVTPLPLVPRLKSALQNINLLLCTKLRLVDRLLTICHSPGCGCPTTFDGLCQHVALGVRFCIPYPAGNGATFTTVRVRKILANRRPFKFRR